MKDKVRQRDEYRLRVLRAMYESTDGDTQIGVEEQNIADSLSKFNVSQKDVFDAIDYLVRRGDMQRFGSSVVGITHEGVEEVESTVRDPDTATKNFDPVVIHNVNNFHGTVGGVQTGSHNTMNVAQQINAPAEIVSHFAALRAEALKLPEDKRSEAIELVNDLEEESKKETPQAFASQRLCDVSLDVLDHNGTNDRGHHRMD